MSSIADRIAALKLQQAGGNIPVGPPPASVRPHASNENGSVASPVQKPRPPPPPPRTATSSVPPANDRAPSTARPIGNQPDTPQNGVNGASQRPPLPQRTSTSKPSAERPTPALPPRRPSATPNASRRGSSDSSNSIATTKSSVSGVSTVSSIPSQIDRSRIRAPDFDPSSLPVLPPRRTAEEKEAADRKYGVVRPTPALRQTKSTPKIAQSQEGTTPPPMPQRPGMPAAPQSQSTRVEPLPPPMPRPSALTMGFSGKRSSNKPPPAPVNRPEPTQRPAETPPPIPVNSKPDLSALLASKPKFQGSLAAAAPAQAAAHTPTGAVAITSFAQFSQILASNRIVVSDFYADWCGPCRNFAPDYERLSKEYSRPNQISFVKINTDHNPDIRDAHQIACWPTLIIFENGSQAQKFQGASEHGIKATVEDLADRAGINLYPDEVAQPVSGQFSASNGNCLICRDFSGPDGHAARFPRQSIPSQDVGWLAQQLTSPFPSPTDKARAIFTWLHHNIAYDTVSFFANNVQPSTPSSTLSSGLAVCEGYAGLFAAMAVKVGLESFVIGGASKGFGHTQISANDPIPDFKSTHAWNVVKIDNNEWKLIDACWGAGNVDRVKGYTKAFSPDRFTQPNNVFGLDHFPEDPSKQFRTDGRQLSWEEFQRSTKDGTACNVYGMATDEGFLKSSFQPLANPVLVAQQPGPTVRFSYHRSCPHWDPIRNGKGLPYLYVLAITKPGTDKTDLFGEFDTNGEVWWCDVPTQALLPGSSAHVMALTKFDKKDGRGLSKQEYLRKKGRVGWGGGYLAVWEIK